ncbi:MAG: ABC-F family ATP-binding cassette domain-containing protein [Marinospirillum sp.]|uniref:ATP-binding cassette domain-containing protein n=1 Tax=Marinospirillum sp. TaxID=2183934 RepID=UPI0019F10CA5|nr:ATP-binding cassette domain-containing protein [Marinospirillum sp.]MBE0506235.1 ABC-F family ATP-binding cassette domain-containing protein [Marinospirillum sp.]
MTLLDARSITFSFNQGTSLFQNLSFQLQLHRTGLVGRNGCGKSTLLALLTGQLQPDAGQILQHGSLAWLSQLRDPQSSVAAFLGIEASLKALQRLQQGQGDTTDLELIADRWLLGEELQQLLKSLALPADPYLPLAQLSGGQQTQLALHWLFSHPADLLLLDEPSNHLDAAGRKWLADQLQQFRGGLLLISHDQQLLEQMDEILELDTTGIRSYRGNFSFWQQQRSLERQALQRALDNTSQRLQEAQHQAQLSRERAARRARTGKQQRASGSQGKLLMDMKKNRAEQHSGQQSRLRDQQQQQLLQEQQVLRQQQARLDEQKLHLPAQLNGKGRLLDVIELQLPRGQQTPLTFSLDQGQKMQLCGNNGSGKSTLLQVLLGSLSTTSGEVRLHTHPCYLDQHFSLLDIHTSALQNLQQAAPGLPESDARTLLANIGLRRERAALLVASLSGGERMKLALLLATRQPDVGLLLLDEPDNHLDLDSKAQLAELLKSWPGALLLVSHDQAFVSACGIRERLELLVSR